MQIKRPKDVLDAFQWYCETCNYLLYEEKLPVQDIVKDLAVVMNKFYTSSALRTCKACGTVMEPPQ
jgi:3-hydroxyanthranilate 3,4-dioxygenase